MHTQSNSQKQIHDKNLSMIGDQLSHESLMNTKYSEYASQCTDPEIQSLFTSASGVHKENFIKLKNYLDTHQ